MTTIGSLFDGIGGGPLAATLCGAVPVWASEIEKFPIRVTELRFPNMIHLGDITKINGSEIPPVDIIIGGSPCQDLSIAGKRAGLAGERSGLFMEQIRIVKEMRIGANRPRFLIWENVPGAYSSNNGEDFRAVLEEVARIADESVSIPRPIDGWANSGRVMGNGWDIAWRTLDAQGWGVPQRRRRIYLVADFGGMAAGEILFERDSGIADASEVRSIAQGLCGDSSESGKKGEGTPSDASGRSYALYMRDGKDGGGKGPLVQTERTGTITTSALPTLFQPLSLFENHGKDSRVTGPHDVSPTVCKQYGTGGNNTPRVAFVKGRRAKSSEDYETWREDETAPTLNNFDMGDTRATSAIIRRNNEISSSRKPLDGSSLESEEDYSARNLLGVRERERARCSPQGRKSSKQLSGESSSTMPWVPCSETPGPEILQSVRTSNEGIGVLRKALSTVQEVRRSLYVQGEPIHPHYSVRRLTPMEAERLQGYPDEWTNIPGASDSNRYKALGNSFAVPCAYFVIQGCVERMQE